MSAIPTLDDLLNARTGGAGATEDIFYWRDIRVAGATVTSPVANKWFSLWQFQGIPAAPTTPPSTSTYPDNTTDGGLKQADPGGGRAKWLVGAAARSALNAGTLLVYDRLYHKSGFSGTTITTQAVSSTITRYTGTASANNFCAVEINTQIGTTGTTAVLHYTPTGGGSSTTPDFLIGGTGLREVHRMLFAPLASGDKGFANVTDIDLLASTVTAGNFNIVIGRPLLYLALSASNTMSLIEMIGEIEEIKTDACIAFAYMGGGTAQPQIMANLTFVES